VYAVEDEVHEDAAECGGVHGHIGGSVGEADVEADLLLLDLAPHNAQSLANCGIRVRSPHGRDLLAARHLEHGLDDAIEAAQLGEAEVHDLVAVLRDLSLRDVAAEHLEVEPDGAERIADLVGEVGGQLAHGGHGPGDLDLADAGGQAFDHPAEGQGYAAHLVGSGRRQPDVEAAAADLVGGAGDGREPAEVVADATKHDQGGYEDDEGHECDVADASGEERGRDLALVHEDDNAPACTCGRGHAREQRLRALTLQLEQPHDGSVRLVQCAHGRADVCGQGRFGVPQAAARVVNDGAILQTVNRSNAPLTDALAGEGDLGEEHGRGHCRLHGDPPAGRTGEVEREVDVVGVARVGVVLRRTPAQLEDAPTARIDPDRGEARDAGERDRVELLDAGRRRHGDEVRVERLVAPLHLQRRLQRHRANVSLEGETQRARGLDVVAQPEQEHCQGRKEGKPADDLAVQGHQARLFREVSPTTGNRSLTGRR
jgi:hypothetical protein